MKGKMIFAVFAMVLMFFCVSLVQASECRKVKANGSGIINLEDLTTDGINKNGGLLNGTIHGTLSEELAPTLDPNTFSYLQQITLTTHKGTLMLSDVGLIDPGNKAFTEIQRVIGGTGVFEGATGILFINGSTDDEGNFVNKTSGEICLVK
jgi:hypothetical protein